MDEIKYIIGSLVGRANNAINDRAKIAAEKQRQVDELQTFSSRRPNRLYRDTRKD